MSLVKVRGKILGPNRGVVDGQVVFRLSEELLDSSNRTIFSCNRLPTRLDSNGEFEVMLAPNDDSTLQPANTYYSVQVVVQGAPTKTWSIQVPLAAGSIVGVDIVDLAPVTAELDPVYSFAFTSTVLDLAERVTLLEALTTGTLDGGTPGDDSDGYDMIDGGSP